MLLAPKRKGESFLSVFNVEIVCALRGSVPDMTVQGAERPAVGLTRASGGMFIEFLRIPLKQASGPDGQLTSYCPPPLQPRNSELPGGWWQTSLRAQSILNPGRERDSEQSAPQQHPAACVGEEEEPVGPRATGHIKKDTSEKSWPTGVFHFCVSGPVLWISLRQLQKATRYQKASGKASLTFKMEELLDSGNDSSGIQT